MGGGESQYYKYVCTYIRCIVTPEHAKILCSASRFFPMKRDGTPLFIHIYIIYMYINRVLLNMMKKKRSKERLLERLK